MSDPQFGQPLKDGEWHLVRGTGINGKHYHRCCDCGLVHEVKFKIFERVEKRHPMMDKLRRLNLKNLAIGMAFWRVQKNENN